MATAILICLAILFVMRMAVTHIDEDEVLYHKNGKAYRLIRWNYFAVIGMSKAPDAWVQQVHRVFGNYYTDDDPEFLDESDDYKLKCGKGIRPPAM